MGSVGDAYDNAMECELLERRRFKTHAEAKMAIFELSRASTICAVGTLPSAICHRSTSNAGTSMR
jgi:hypothetical protein